MKIPLLRYLFCAFVAASFSASAIAQSLVGGIHALKVEGEVLKIAIDGTQTPIKERDVLKQSDTVSTGRGASVILSFDNGSTVKLGADSRLAIEEFLIDPFAADYKVAGATAEPSVSKTTLNLTYGEMVGDVKKLNTSSSYSIKTPVGAAGIRGTIYRIVFRPTSDGKAFFTVQTAEGLVVMEGVTATDVPVDAGKEVVVEVDTSQPTPTGVIVSQGDIPPAAQALITTAASTIVQAVQETVIPPPTGNPPVPPVSPVPPGPPVIPPIDPTSGAGLGTTPPNT